MSDHDGQNGSQRGPLVALGVVVTSVVAAPVPPKAKPKAGEKAVASQKPEAPGGKYFKPESSASHGSVTIEGRGVSYDAVAGTLVVHPKDWDDAAQAVDHAGAVEIDASRAIVRQ